MDNIETLLERFVDDREQLSDEQLDALIAAARDDASVAATLKDQLVIDELLAQRMAFDRRDFVAQVAQRIRDGELNGAVAEPGDAHVAEEMRQLLDVELSKHQHEANRRQSSRWRYAAALALLIAIAGGSWWWWHANARPLAFVEQVIGEPKLVRGKGVRTIQVGDALRTEDVLTTSPRDEISLRYRDGTEVRLAGDTSVALTADDSTRGKRVNVSWGTVVAEVVPQPAGRPMKLATPLSVATVRGTRLWLSADAERTRLDVIEGVVDLTRIADGQTLAVRSREFALATAEEFSVEPLTWPIDRRDALVLLETAAADATNHTRDELTGDDVPLDLRPRGQARLDHNFAFILGGGSFMLENASAAVFGSCPRTNELTMEATITPRVAKPPQPACILACASSERDYNFELGQQGDRLYLRMRTAGAGNANPSDEVIELCRIAAGQPQHVAVTYRPGDLVCYLNGRRVYHDGRVTGDFAGWKRYAVTIGDVQRGGRDWAGTLEGLAIYDRSLEDDEVRRNAELYRELTSRRPPVPQVEIAATLLEKSPVPTPGDIAPSPAALVVCRYRVDNVLRGELLESEVLVAQWAVLDGAPQSIADLELGAKRRMTIERLGLNAQLEGVPRVDEFRTGDDPAKPRHYEVSDP